MRNVFKPLDSDKNNEFYKDLSRGSYDGYIWGKDKRFNISKALKSASIKKHFQPKIRENISKNDIVLDVGCGNGMFSQLVAPQCKRIYGIDVSIDMLKQCSQNLKNNCFGNEKLLQATSSKLPFPDRSFNLVYMVDVVHHIPNPENTIREVFRILKKNGKFIVFEPNKFNVLLAFLCLIDRNEWGALRLGSIRKYKELFREHFIIEQIEYNGLLIGPDSKPFQIITDILNSRSLKKVIGWQNPKIFILMKKYE